MKKIGLFLVTLMLPAYLVAQDINPPEDAYEAPKEEYSPFVDDHFPTRVLWGDTHLHTSWSVDAGFLGATLGPEEAYQASMGLAVTAKSGFRFKLARPLDFVVISDHAESYGLLPPLPAVELQCASSAVGISPPMKSSAMTLPGKATRTACRWAATSPTARTARRLRS